MDFEKFISPVTDYLNFSILFWTGNTSYIVPFQGLEGISPSAVLLCVVGIGISLVLSSIKIGTVPSDPNQINGAGPKLDTNSLLLLTITSLLTPLLLELSFLMTNFRPRMTSQPVFATFNGSFLSYALIAPLSGLYQRLNFINVEMQKVGGRTRAFAIFLNTVLGLAFLYLFILCMQPILVLHNLTLSQIWIQFALSLLIFIVVAAPFCWFLWKWNTYVNTPKS